jgi:hypothetical protein
VRCWLELLGETLDRMALDREHTTRHPRTAGGPGVPAINTVAQRQRLTRSIPKQ